MKISGTADLAAPPETVFAALNDPAVLAATIPGVQSLEQVSDDTYRMTVVAGVASIKGSYEGQVGLADQQPPHSFTLRASGSGAPGTVDATVAVRLSEERSGTRLEYDADAAVGGMIGGVGQRMLSGVAKKMAGQFFTAVGGVIANGVPEPAQGEPVEAAPGADAAPSSVPEPAVAGGQERPRSAAVDDLRVPFWVVLAGVGTGAFCTLAGVAFGALLSRRRQGS